MTRDEYRKAFHLPDDYVLSDLPYTEMGDLRNMVLLRHPKWDARFCGINGGLQIIFFKRGRRVCDVVLHEWSYGGEDGLLEFYAGDDVTGYLNAEEAYAEVVKALRDTKNILEGT